MQQLLTIGEASHLLNISRWTLYRHVAERRLPVVRIGRSVRIRPEDLDRYLRNATAQGGVG